ncbi:hypothetical protein IWQ61_002578 [Dispira simplex]|nr:hypothetical protein IWQ61_002578 [Dispira simplex]
MSTRHRRHLRRQSWVQKVQETPQNLLWRWIEDFETYDWDKLQKRLRWPLMLLCNGIFLCLRLLALLDTQPTLEHASILRDPSRPVKPTKPERPGLSKALGYDATSSLGSASTWGLGNMITLPGVRTMAVWMLILVSIGNTLYLFTRLRSYQMLHADPHNPLNSEHVRLTALDATRPAWADRWYGRLMWPLIKNLVGTDQSRAHQILEIDVWDPPLLSLHLFCWFSPGQILALQLVTLANWYYVFPCTLVLGFQLHYFSRQYMALLKDKQILFGQMFTEYNIEYVNPRLHVRKVDRSTSTHDLVPIRPPQSCTVDLPLFPKDSPEIQRLLHRSPRRPRSAEKMESTRRKPRFGRYSLMPNYLGYERETTDSPLSDSAKNKKLY